MDRIFIKTYGCTLNASDSEVIAGILKEAGFELVGTEEEAELVIVNTCIVKGPTESKVLDYLAQLKKAGKKTIVAGCMPQALPEKILGYSMIGTEQLTRIVEVVEETLNNNTVVLIAREKNPRLNLPKIRRNRIIEIIPICSGCLGNCSYCIVKRARGELISYDKNAIVEQAQKAVMQGAKEIWLTAQDTGCYGKDIGESLSSLLKALIAIPGNYKIRLGMINPDFVKEYLEDLIKIFSSDRMFKFMHMPVQSGSDEILASMNRRYSASDFVSTVKRLKSEIPSITISTDIICGYPGETDQQFLETVNLLQESRPSIVNISRFWKRPYTKAARLKQLPVEQVKSRSRRLSSLFEWIAFENSKSWIGWEGKVVIDEVGKPGTGTWIGRNFAYKQVVLQGDYRIGQELMVKVTKATAHDLRAIPA
ncbi:tRNA (N(6)-L-threonylcarbamoyladenosine(37)-C(2))-methylthiotransferase [Candidatus Woesearchaeota archaeon]|nr:tRNA (N(6)-L-threonylcarbamoyladenosine(37)-C(2))-methylthiotransferase [Candidatus Woesearchaeota archaeon]